MKQEEVKGLLHIKIAEMKACNPGHGPSKLDVRVGSQAYMLTPDLTKGQIEVNQIRLFDCSSSDTIQLDYSDDVKGVEGQLRFPLRKLTEMPRVKHLVEAIMIKKREKKSQPSKKVQNLIEVGLEIIFLNNVQGKFIISSIEAELLRDTELIGNMDPYVLVQLDDQKITTKAKESQGKQCAWSEKIEMKVCQGGSSMLKFRIFDRDPVRDDLVGQVQISLLKEGLLIPQEKPKEKQFNLIYNNSMAGTIKIEYQFKILPFNF